MNRLQAIISARRFYRVLGLAGLMLVVWLTDGKHVSEPFRESDFSQEQRCTETDNGLPLDRPESAILLAQPMGQLYAGGRTNESYTFTFVSEHFSTHPYSRLKGKTGCYIKQGRIYGLPPHNRIEAHVWHPSGLAQVSGLLPALCRFRP